MNRFRQCLLIGSFLAVCWLGMMAVHELGHVLAGWATGGKVSKVVLHPLAISRTDVSPNPRPLAVAWAGPMVGVLLPLLAWAGYRAARLPGAYLLRFYAGFCLIANGAYISIGSFEGVGDAGDLIRLGTPPWLLWLFGAVTMPAGFFLWHRLGTCFGLGEARGKVDPRAVYAALALFVATWTAAWVLSPPS